MNSPQCLLTLTAHGRSARVLIAVDSTPVVLGRHDAGKPRVSEVDLAPLEAHRFGISRKHALLSLSESALAIEDLGSRNGTFVNGERLAPYVPHILHDGDTLRLGRLSLKLRLVESATGSAY